MARLGRSFPSHPQAGRPRQARAANLLQGTASIAGVGTLTGTGVRRHTATGSIAGAGTVTAAGVVRKLGTSSVAGTGTVSSSGVSRTLGQGTVTAVGSVTAAAIRRAVGSASVAASSDVHGSWRQRGQAQLAGLGTVTAAGVVHYLVQGSAAVTAAGAVSGGGARRQNGTGAVSGYMAAVGYGIRTAKATGAIAAAGSVAGTGTIKRAGQAAASGVGSVTAGGVRRKLGQVTVPGGGVLSATGRYKRVGRATVAGVATVLGQGQTAERLPVSSWQNPRRPAMTGKLAPIAEALDSLEKYLRRPVMPNGFVIGDTQSGDPTLSTWIDLSQINTNYTLIDTVAPGGVANLTLTGYVTSILAKWDAPADTDIVGYEVQVASDSGFTSIVQTREAGGTNCLVSNLSYDIDYYVRVRAVDTSNNVGPWSATVSGQASRVNGGADIVSGSITTDKLQANSVTAGKVAAMYLEAGKYIRSTTYTAGSVGWSIDANGNAEFQNATIRGHLQTATLDTSHTLSVSGTIQSSTYSSTAGWKIDNAGNAIFRTATISGTLETTKLTSGNTLTIEGNLSVTGTAQSALFDGTNGWKLTNAGDAIFRTATIRITGASTVATGGSVTSSSGSATPGAASGWQMLPDGTAVFNSVFVKGTLSASDIIGGTVKTDTLTVKSAVQSENYNATTHVGWKIDGAGNAEFNNLLVRGSSWTGGTLSSAAISAGSISGASITAGSITGATISGNTISGGTIDGTTITGSTVQAAPSSSSSARVALETASIATLKFYTGVGTEYASVVAQGDRLGITSPNASGTASYIDLYGSADSAYGTSEIVVGASRTTILTDLYAGGSLYASSNVKGANVIATTAFEDNGGAAAKLRELNGGTVKFQYSGGHFYIEANNSGTWVQID